MTSNLGWVDFSATDRNRVATILDLLKPEGMVDELGLGVLRDSLANQLFPGISTIQTRAKYYFLTAHILRDYQSDKTLRKRYTPSQYLELREYEVMWSLGEKYNYERGSGIIGVTKRRPNKVLRRPSAIYWNGLNFFKFIDAQGESLETFLHRDRKSSLTELLRQSVDGDDGGDDVDAGYDNFFRIRVPIRKDWSGRLALELEREEAEFFADRVRQFAPFSFLARLVTDNQLWQLARPSKVEEQHDFQTLVKTYDLASLPSPLRETLVLAHDFSELMYGAHLAYNCQLQRDIFDCDSFENNWNEWREQLPELMLDFEGFEPNDVLCLSSTAKPSTKQFVSAWWSEAKKGFQNTAKRDRMVLEQERVVKGRKARLAFNQTDDVVEEVWLGLTVFDYRFTQGRRMAADIRQGLESGNA